MATPDQIEQRGIELDIAGRDFLTNTLLDNGNPTFLVAKRLKSKGIAIRISEPKDISGLKMEGYVGLYADSDLANRLFTEITHSPEINALEGVYDPSLELDLSKCNWPPETKIKVAAWHREIREKGQRDELGQLTVNGAEFPPQKEFEDLVNGVVDAILLLPSPVFKK
jgi:hypothetical protein